MATRHARARAELQRMKDDGEAPGRVTWQHLRAVWAHDRGGRWMAIRVAVAIIARAALQVGPLIALAVGAALVDCPAWAAGLAALTVVASYPTFVAHRKWPWGDPLRVAWIEVGLPDAS